MIEETAAVSSTRPSTTAPGGVGALTKCFRSYCCPALRTNCATVIWSCVISMPKPEPPRRGSNFLKMFSTLHKTPLRGHFPHRIRLVIALIDRLLNYQLYEPSFVNLFAINPFGKKAISPQLFTHCSALTIQSS
jgi:hypothetical protein